MGRKKYRTDFLFADVGFLIGMGAVLAVAGNYFEFNHSDSDEEADSRAIESDWGVVGQDMEETVEKNPVNSLKLAR